MEGSALRRFQRGFAARLLGRRTEDRPDDPAGFAIHRSNVRVSLRQTLIATFPVVGQLVGEGFFNGMADAFVDAQPPGVGWLSAYGENFAEFITSYPPARTLSYLPDIARIEWARVHAANARFDPGVDLAVLAGLPPHQLDQQPLLTPAAASLIASPYPVFDVWHAHQADDPERALSQIDPASGGQVILVTRIQPWATSVVVLEPCDAALLWAAQRPCSLSALYAAAASVDPDYDLAVGLHRLVGLKALSHPDVYSEMDQPLGRRGS
jgi:hypothetical protein